MKKINLTLLESQGHPILVLLLVGSEGQENELEAKKYYERENLQQHC